MREKAQELLCESFGPFGPIVFPYVRMGAIDSLDLFGNTELMILKMYHHNKERWTSALDIGANLGLHSICMAKLGWNVRAYEPDPHHFQKLLDNIVNNNVRVNAFMSAVHTSDGNARFIRVLNNLTGNHLEGYKDSYGPREETIVQTIDARKLWSWADFAKIDSEGNEADLCDTITAADMKHMDVVMEVRNVKNAAAVYGHFTRLDVPMWSQKTDWKQVQAFVDMPHKNREGSLFVGHSGPWP